jgi:recombination protein RecT
MSGQELTQRTPAQELVWRVRGDEFKQQMALALPEGISADRFIRATVTALMANPDLATQASHDSIFTALLRSAQDGLVPDGREAALVVYSGKAQYLPMVGGLRKIAGEHGWALVTEVAKQGDVFEYELGLEPKLRHVPARPGVDRGQTIAAYCVASHPSGHRFVEVMLINELEQIRATSKKPTSGPWKDWTDRMYEKTVGKRAFAKLPLGELDARVLRIVAASETDPEEASRLMYGPSHNETSAALPPAGVDDRPSVVTTSPPAQAGAQHANVGTEGQQAAAEVVAADATAAAPDPDDDPEPSLDDEPEQTSFETPTSAADDPIVVAARAASQFQIPNGDHKGLSLAELQAKGEAVSVRWIKWALRKGDSLQPDDFRRAVWAFARVYMPDAYQEVLAWHESQVAS